MTIESEPTSSVSPNVARARELLWREFEAWNSHDPERVLPNVAEDILWEDPSMPEGQLRGKKAVGEWLMSIWRASPDMTFDPVGEPLIPAGGRRSCADFPVDRSMSLPRRLSALPSYERQS